MIDDISCGEDEITDQLRNSLVIEHLPCDGYRLDLSHSESELETALCVQEQLTVTMTVTDECGHKGSCLTTVIMKEQRLDIYPNPATDEINISNLKGEKYSVYTYNGELIQKDLEGDKIEVSNMKSGIYILVTASGRNTRFTVLR